VGLVRDHHAVEAINTSGEDLFEYGLAVCLREINVLSRPKHGAFSGLPIGRYSPQPQSHIEGIDAECRPEGKLADPMLFGMAGGAQRNGVAIARFHPDTAIGSGAHMRGLRRRGSTAGDARKLTDKSQVLQPPTQVRLGLAARNGAGDARDGHMSQGSSARSSSGAA